MNAIPKHLKPAYRHCGKIARDHYENFPVASVLLPRKMRQHITAIYAFARRADDIADEGQLPADKRLTQLAMLETGLRRTLRGEPSKDAVLIALSHTIHSTKLPYQNIADLLSAFRQDVSVKRYADFAQILDYARRSANPIGRMLLHLAGAASEQNLQYSDHICSALQLINFYQDLAADVAEKDRIYIPEQELAAYEVSAATLKARQYTPLLGALMHFQYYRAQQLLRAGAPLGQQLRGRMGLEIRAIIHGGELILHKLFEQTDVYMRPTLSKAELSHIMRAAICKRPIIND